MDVTALLGQPTGVGTMVGELAARLPRVDPEAAADANGAARIALDLSRVHYFDPTSELTIS